MVKLGLVAAAAGLIYLGVKAYGRLSRKGGAQTEHDAAHHANDEARARFDAATSRPLSPDLDTLVARIRARRDRRRGLRRKDRRD